LITSTCVSEEYGAAEIKEGALRSGLAAASLCGKIKIG